MVALTSRGDGKPSGPNARTVINALMQRDWRIVHIAAHGEPPELIGPAPVKPGDPPQQIGNPRGVVLSNEVYLGPREINSMRTIPELVFVNCCYLAARDLQQLFTTEWLDCETRYRNDRAEFASGVAEALIKVGVRCVIAAGWAVDDTQADGVRAHLLRAAPDRTPIHRCGGVAPGQRRGGSAATPGRPTSATAIRTGSSGGE